MKQPKLVVALMLSFLVVFSQLQAGTPKSKSKTPAKVENSFDIKELLKIPLFTEEIDKLETEISTLKSNGQSVKAEKAEEMKAVAVRRYIKFLVNMEGKIYKTNDSLKLVYANDRRYNNVKCVEIYDAKNKRLISELYRSEMFSGICFETGKLDHSNPKVLGGISAKGTGEGRNYNQLEHELYYEKYCRTDRNILELFEEHKANKDIFYDAEFSIIGTQANTYYTGIKILKAEVSQIIKKRWEQEERINRLLDSAYFGQNEKQEILNNKTKYLGTNLDDDDSLKSNIRLYKQSTLDKGRIDSQINNIFNLLSIYESDILRKLPTEFTQISSIKAMLASYNDTLSNLQNKIYSSIKNRIYFDSDLNQTYNTDNVKNVIDADKIICDSTLINNASTIRELLSIINQLNSITFRVKADSVKFVKTYENPVFVDLQLNYTLESFEISQFEKLLLKLKDKLSINFALNFDFKFNIEHIKKKQWNTSDDYYGSNYNKEDWIIKSDDVLKFSIRTSPMLNYEGANNTDPLQIYRCKSGTEYERLASNQIYSKTSMSKNLTKKGRDLFPIDLSGTCTLSFTSEDNLISKSVFNLESSKFYMK